MHALIQHLIIAFLRFRYVVRFKLTLHGIVVVTLLYLAMLLNVFAVLGKLFTFPAELDAHTPHQLELYLLVVLAPDLFVVLLHGCRNLSLRLTRRSIRLRL